VWTGAVTAALVGIALAAYLLAGPVLLAAAATADVDEDLLDDPELPGLEQRSVVRAADGGILAVLHAEVDRVEIPLDAVPDHVRQAVLVAEDRRFYEHDGYDLRAIGRAVWANFQAGEPAEGAATTGVREGDDLIPVAFRGDLSAAGSSGLRLRTEVLRYRRRS
jgi:membrane peptidoglycan carboxypeptidase